jgi:hypothetical protein
VGLGEGAVKACVLKAMPATRRTVVMGFMTFPVAPGSRGDVQDVSKRGGRKASKLLLMWRIGVGGGGRRGAMSFVKCAWVSSFSSSSSSSISCYNSHACRGTHTGCFQTQTEKSSAGLRRIDRRSDR